MAVSLLAPAWAAADAGRDEEAIALAAQALAAAPTEPVLRLEAALLQARLRRPRAALALLLPALCQAPQPLGADLAAMVADRLGALGEMAAAAAIARRIVSLSARPAAARLLLRLGLPAYRQSLQDAPDRDLLAAMVAAACRYPEVLVSDAGGELARLVEEAGEDDLLCALGRAAPRRIATPPAGPSAPGLLLLATQRITRARIAFLAAQAAAPDDAAARFNAGFAALAEGDLASAEALLGALPAVGEEALATAAWPYFADRPWPFAAPPAALCAVFAARLPQGKSWPRIRLVTPCLNPGPWLEETILSVLHQHYPALEHVIVDGGSRDGTPALLARYRDRLQAVIIAPDEGPAAAIAKGLADCDADLIGWLNADDLLAPCALFQLALAWVADMRADLVCGFAIAHRRYHPVAVQRPLAEGTEAFRPDALGDIFGRWERGAFFLQPEVLIARRCFETLGGLDTSLAAVFDYDLWLRAATAGARPQRVAWPAAFYRLHPGQRSGRRAALLAEQVAVRDRYLRPHPTPQRRAAIVARLRRALSPAAAMARLLLIDPRCGENISAAALAEAQNALARQGIALALAPEVPPGAVGADFVLRIARAHEGGAWIEHLRANGFRGPIIAWLAEDDRDAPSHAAMLEKLDIAIPARAQRVAFLRQSHALLLDTMPPPSGIVAVAEAERAFATPQRESFACAAPWAAGSQRLAAALRDHGPMPIGDRHDLVLALLAGRAPAAEMPADVASLVDITSLPEARQARHELGKSMLLAPALLRLLAQLRALAQEQEE